MTSFANKFNKVGFGIDTKDYTYCKLAELYAEDPKAVRPINGIYINNTPLGASPVIIDAAAKRLVNLPQHTAITCSAILADPEAVQAIKDGKVGYTIYEYEARGKKCYSIHYVDM